MSTDVVSIALHYFRLPRTHWELYLTRMSQLGIETIYAPVPWGFHEFAANKFDLTGLSNPRRDAAGFIKLCLALKFKVILSLIPGADTPNHLVNHGLPGWLLNRHPEIRAEDKTGAPQNYPVAEHPVYLEFLERWLRESSRALSPFQSNPKQVQVQIDSAGSPLDFGEHTAKVQWPIWLRKKYTSQGGIEAINAAYQPETPFKSVNDVLLTASPPGKTHQQDVAEFTDYTRQNAYQTHITLLKEHGWTVTDSEATIQPPHGVTIDPDYADVGTAFHWADDAPIDNNSLPRYSFWQQKQKHLENRLSSEEAGRLFFVSPGHQLAYQVNPHAVCYRLLLSGDIHLVTPDTQAETTTLACTALDRHGYTDVYFTLPKVGTPVTGYLKGSLQQLLGAKKEALTYSINTLRHLVKMLQPPTVAPGVEPPAPVLSEAQAALSEANVALQKAAASIGALEEVFALGLNKPQPVEGVYAFLNLDSTALRPVRETCQRVLTGMEPMVNTDVPQPFTVEQYNSANQDLNEAANQAILHLGAQLKWLREALATGGLESSAWAVHAQLETVLHNLKAGVLRL